MKRGKDETENVLIVVKDIGRPGQFYKKARIALHSRDVSLALRLGTDTGASDYGQQTRSHAWLDYLSISSMAVFAAILP